MKTVYGIKEVKVSYHRVYVINVKVTKTLQMETLAKQLPKDLGLDYYVVNTQKGKEMIQFISGTMDIKTHNKRAKALNKLEQKYNWVS